MKMPTKYCRKHGLVACAESGRCQICAAAYPDKPPPITAPEAPTAPKSLFHRERVRGWWRVGMSLPPYPSPLECEACGRKSIRTLHADHNHETGKFRGWLCGQCNRGIGQLGDNVAGVLAALSYLVKAQ